MSAPSLLSTPGGQGLLGLLMGLLKPGSTGSQQSAQTGTTPGALPGIGSETSATAGATAMPQQNIWQGGLFGQAGLFGNTGAAFGLGGTNVYQGNFDFSGFGGGGFFGQSALKGQVNPWMLGQMQQQPQQSFLPTNMGFGGLP